jgi:hypothetical protein
MPNCLVVISTTGFSSHGETAPKPRGFLHFERGTCTADTLMMLAAKVNGRFQLVFTIEEVEEL